MTFQINDLVSLLAVEKSLIHFSDLLKKEFARLQHGSGTIALSVPNALALAVIKRHPDMIQQDHVKARQVRGLDRQLPLLREWGFIKRTKSEEFGKPWLLSTTKKGDDVLALFKQAIGNVAREINGDQLAVAA